MKREINYRLLVYLLSGLTTSIFIALAVHQLQMHRHAESLRIRAEQSQDEGRLQDTLNLLQRYLVFAPNDNSARARYGEILEQLATSDHERWRALDVYEQVLFRDPSRRNVRQRLVQLALALGWTSEARAHLDILIREQPDQGELHCLLGRCQEEAGEFSLAAVSYEKAYQQDPTQLEAYIRLALLLQDRLDQPEKAEQVLDELVRGNDRSAEVHLARAMHRLQQGRLTESATDLERACQLSGDEPRILLVLADLERRRGRWTQARHLLEKARAREPGNLAPHLALASLERQRHDPRQAIIRLQEALKAFPDQPDLLLLLGETYLEVGEESPVESAIASLRRVGMPPGFADYLQGCLQAQRRQWQEAIRTFEEVEQAQDSSAALVNRACLARSLCYEKIGDPTSGLEALRRAVERDKSSVLVRIALAEALQRTGHFEEALEQYREVVTMAQAPDESWLRLGQLLFQRNRTLPQQKQRWKEVEKVLERASSFPTLEVPLAVLRSQVFREQGEAEKARSILEAAAVAHPDDPEPTIALADLALIQGDFDRSHDILDRSSQRLENCADLYKAQIALALRQPLHQATRTLRSLENKCYGLSPEVQRLLRKNLAEAYFRLGEIAEGRRLSASLASQLPQDFPSRLLLLDLAVQGCDETLLASISTDLRKLEGEEGTWWRYGEAARFLLQTRRSEPQEAAVTLQAARTLIDDLSRRRPDWSRAALLEAMLQEVDREPTKAANAYLRAFRGSERIPGLPERLVSLLVEQGRLDEADEVGLQIEKEGQLSAQLARQGAEVALRLHNKERARTLARLAVPKDTRDYLQLIWLGQVLTQAGRPDEGVEALRQALHFRDDLAEPWLALLANLVQGDQIQDADELLDEMRRRLPSLQLPLALAVAEEVFARWDRAEQQYLEAMARMPQDALVLQRAASFYLRFNRVKAAEPLLRRLMSPQVDGSPESQAWAQRQLALLLAFSGSEGRIHEALALLPNVAERKNETLLDTRARLFVEGMQPDKRRNSLRQLEASIKVQPLLPEELFCLVRLYEAEGDEEAAQEQMLNLLALEPKNTEYLAHQIERLLHRDRSEEAWPWIRRLDKLEPKSLRIEKFKQAVIDGQRTADSKADR